MRKTSFLLFLLIPLNVFLQPVGYYNGTEGLRGDALKSRLHQIIKGQDALSYYFAKHVLYHADADPSVSGNVLLVYTGRSHDALDYGTGTNKINREHVWAKSHGGFSGILPMDSDVHNLKPADATANGARSNLDFDWSLYSHPSAPECKYTPGTSWEPRDPVKGDIARIIFYMDTRYQGTDGEMDLTVVDQLNTYPNKQHGKLSALLEWNIMDNPDQFERNRNDVIDHFQKNRNPFIDHPQFVELIWGHAALPEFAIGNVGISDQQPESNETVTIFCQIDPMPEPGNVRLFYGDAFNYLLNDVEMNFDNGTWSAMIPAHQAGSVVYNAIRVDNGSGWFTWAPTYSYRVAASFGGQLVPITEIQGSADVSPYAGQVISTTGTVTAFFNSGYFIQAGEGPRTGLYIYDPNRYPAIGDSIVITGQVKEHFGLTEIAGPDYYLLIKTDRPVPEPAVITAAEIGEDWESVLVRIKDATCTFSQHWTNNDMWRINDGTGTVNVKNNEVFSLTPSLNRNYTITGPLNYDYSEWKIELRNLQDVADPTSVLDDIAVSGLAVYPNPAFEKITVELPGIKGINASVKVFDIMGIERHTEKIDPHTTSITIDLKARNLANGVYLIVYSDKNITASKRMLFYRN
jgi:endonuclease I